MAGAARLNPLRYPRFSTVALLSCAGIHGLTRRPNIAQLDTPPGLTIARDASLITSGRRAKAEADSQKPSDKFTKDKDTDLVDEANDLETYAPGFEDDDDNAWANFSRNFDIVRQGISRIDWFNVGDKVREFMLPPWARYIPEGISKLQFELSMREGTLAHEIWEESHDPDINPEILLDARVRIGDTLCDEELEFRKKRKKHVVKNLAKYLDIPEEDIHPDDVPTIAMCGSGGGLRALVAGASSYYSAQQAGLFDCVTYTAGVSGSCWLQTLYYSTLGRQNHLTLLNHIKNRIGTHIAFPPTALKIVTSAPTNKFILSGFIEKLKGDPGAEFGIVDIYSLLLAARLMVPKGDLDVQDVDLKMSNQRLYIEDGKHPMPIYTAVRHEIPIDEEDRKDAISNEQVKEKIKEKVRKESWFQWIEMHPWEVFCEEFGAGIPTWALGRPFEDGKNKILDTGVGLPEMRQSLLLGIFGSAFCATLSHYYKEIRPAMIGLSGFGGLDEMLEHRNDDLVKVHPIDPATVPNWCYGLKNQLPSTCPDSLFKSDHLQLMDAGMSNNLPIYPLLRPGRDVDILVAFDASADIQKENWLSVVDGYAKQRGIRSWPVGTGWPRESETPEKNAQDYDDALAHSSKEAATKLADAKSKGDKKTEKEEDNLVQSLRPPPPNTITKAAEDSKLGYCNIWVGSSASRDSTEEPPPSKRLDFNSSDDSTFHLMKPDSGLAVIYFPLLPNEEKVPGVHPDKTPFMSTWNFIYTPEEIDKVVKLAQTNFEEGADSVKRTVRAVYERKKNLREQKDGWTIARNLGKNIRETGDGFTHG